MKLRNDAGVVLEVDDPAKIARMLAGGWVVDSEIPPEKPEEAAPVRRGRPPKVRE